MLENFDFQVFLQPGNIWFLVEGLGKSFVITFLAVLGGLAFGTILALMRLSGIRLLSLTAAAYVNLLRSIPLIMVLFWFFLLVPFGAFYAAVTAFIIFEAAYYSEIMRAGIQSVSSGQVHAGQATGLGYWQIQKFIVLPQAFRNMIPILISQGIILFQDTSLLFVIGFYEFFTSATIIAKQTGRLVELYLFIAFIYFAICFSASMYVKRLQAGLKK